MQSTGSTVTAVSTPCQTMMASTTSIACTTILPTPNTELTSVKSRFTVRWKSLAITASSSARAGYTKMRITAYAAYVAHDALLRQQAVQIMEAALTSNGSDRWPATPQLIESPRVPRPSEEISPLCHSGCLSMGDQHDHHLRVAAEIPPISRFSDLSSLRRLRSAWGDRPRNMVCSVPTRTGERIRTPTAGRARSVPECRRAAAQAPASDPLPPPR
jgi:hypothetical protein